MRHLFLWNCSYVSARYIYVGYPAWVMGAHKGWGPKENCCILLWGDMASPSNVLCHQSKTSFCILWTSCRTMCNKVPCKEITIFSENTNTSDPNSSLVVIITLTALADVLLVSTSFDRLEGRRCMIKQEEEKALNFHHDEFQSSSLTSSEV